ncbi:MAG: hypothetical protein E7459_08290 [Ruminococcaceae bacterium]|nr:hypothetical protein [Oscillospiraceae bacterium]
MATESVLQANNRRNLLLIAAKIASCSLLYSLSHGFAVPPVCGIHATGMKRLYSFRYPRRGALARRLLFNPYRHIFLHKPTAGFQTWNPAEMHFG